MKRPSRRAKRTGAAVVLVVVLLAVLITLTVALASMTGLNTRMSRNIADLQQARLLAESGLAFAGRELRSLRLPADTDDANLLANLAAALCDRVNGTVNLMGVTVTSGEDWIAVPDIEIDEGCFEMRITRSAEGTLVLAVTGAVGQARCAVAADVVRLSDPGNTAFDYGVAARGPIMLGGNAEIRGRNELTEASVISVTDGPVAVSIEGNAVIDGDISSAGEATSVVIDGTPTIAGSQDPEVIAEHIHFDVAEPVFPVVDTSIFKPLATNVIDGSTDTSQHGLVFENVLIKAGTNPTFASDVVLNGVVYIEAPNIVSFAGKVTLNGLVATDDSDLGIQACKLNFAAQVEAYGVTALPDEPQFAAVKELTGTFIVAPGFDVSFAGQFTTINGTIAADKLTFSGQAEGTVEGSVIGLADYPVSIDGTVNICIDRSGGTGGDAGFSLPVLLDVDSETYREVAPGGP